MKKILHLCLASFYIDGFSYQENLLPKWHKRLGYDVEIIASQQTFDAEGRLSVLPEGERTYINENGIKVTRLDYRAEIQSLRSLRQYKGLLAHLEKAAPDILFIHGCQFLDMTIVANYLKNHSDVTVFVDNHADYSNSATNWFSRAILHRIVWRRMAQIIEPYTSMFWGVLPARVDFLVENYKLPANKCALLLMGADDDEVTRASSLQVRSETRKSLGIRENELLVVTGGKIDSAKKHTLDLMDAVSEMAERGENIRLCVFGPVVPELKEEFSARLDSPYVIYIPWANTRQSYDFFSAADLVCFPGRHSVYWEQAAAMGKPLLVLKWPGTTHVNVCDNASFLTRGDRDEIKSELCRIVESDLAQLNDRARQARRFFLYSDISKKSIGLSIHD